MDVSRDNMTIAEWIKYMAKQQAAGWPGSKSIHPNGRGKKRGRRPLDPGQEK